MKKGHAVAQHNKSKHQGYPTVSNCTDDGFLCESRTADFFFPSHRHLAAPPCCHSALEKINVSKKLSIHTNYVQLSQLMRII